MATSNQQIIQELNKLKSAGKGNLENMGSINIAVPKAYKRFEQSLHSIIYTVPPFGPFDFEKMQKELDTAVGNYLSTLQKLPKKGSFLKEIVTPEAHKGNPTQEDRQNSLSELEKIKLALGKSLNTIEQLKKETEDNPQIKSRKWLNTSLSTKISDFMYRKPLAIALSAKQTAKKERETPRLENPQDRTVETVEKKSYGNK